jgi:hypothetical protein
LALSCRNAGTLTPCDGIRDGIVLIVFDILLYNQHVNLTLNTTVHNADLAAVFEKAQKLGVPTVEEKEFLKLLER